MVLLAGVGLHLGIDYAVRVGFFSYGVFVAYLAFLPPQTASALILSARDNSPVFAALAPEETVVVKTAAVLLYDADCGFCRWAIDRLLAWDRPNGCAWFPFRTPRRIGCYPASTRTRGWARGISSWTARCTRVAPSSAPAAVTARRTARRGRGRFPGVTERTYRWVSRHRDRFGRMAGARCEVDPTRRRS